MIAERSIVVRTGVQLASPLAVLVAAYIFFAGHNRPGGGFAAGLVLAAVIVLRMVVGLSTPQHPLRLLAAGGIVVGLVAIAPLFVGDALLDQVVVDAEAPLLGKIKAGAALVFDLGVVLVVVGFVAAALQALGAEELGRASARRSAPDPGDPNPAAGDAAAPDPDVADSDVGGPSAGSAGAERERGVGA